LAEVESHSHILDMSHLVVRDRASGRRVLTQIYDARPLGSPRELLLLLDLGPKATLTFDLYDQASSEPMPSRVFARQVPERKDDFAWENDRVAYRVYGPALEASGEIGSGIDVWSKRVPDLVINAWYKRDFEGQRTHNPAMSYHVDNGQGLDSYDVGTSRGCGGTAVWESGKLVASRNVSRSRILAEGPIRVAFELEYAPWKAAGTEVEESKYVELDAGSHLNHLQSTFRFNGPRQIDVAAGLALHQPARRQLLAQGRIVSVWDSPQLASAGHIVTGLILPPPEKAAFSEREGNAVLVVPVKPGASIRYYAGAGWSQADMPTQEAWNAYLIAYLERLEHPVVHRWNTGKIP
jgi:pectinesterase